MCTYCGCFLSKTKTSEIQTVRSHHEPQSISTLRLQFTMHFAVPCYDAKVVLFSFVSVGVKPCETNGKAKRKKHQRCSWQLNCLQEKKKLLQNKLWKREQYQSRPDLFSNHLQRLYLFFGLHDVHMCFCFLFVRNVSSWIHHPLPSRHWGKCPPSTFQPITQNKIFLNPHSPRNPSELQTCVSLKTSLWSWSIPTKNASFISVFMIPCKCQNKISCLSAFRNRFKAQGATHTFLAVLATP